jgi:flagellar hook-associated protein 3 FlgL
MIPPLSARVGHDAAVRRLKGLSEQLAVVQEQISTGKRLQKPGDDAIAFARIATLRRANQGAEVQRKAMDAASARLSASEVALAGIADLAARAKELALAGRNGALNAGDRTVLALEVRELLAAARGLAEARGADGEALFAGVGVTPSYADDAEGQAVWAGLGLPPEVATIGRRIAAGITGPEAFGVTAPLDPLAPPPDPVVPPPPRQRNFFDSLAHLAESLEETRPLFFDAAMDEAIAAIDDHVGGLAGAQALIGARAARLEAETERLDRSQLEIKSSLSKLEDTDMTEAIARLDRLSVVLEAAQASFARVSRLSLWDDIR